MPSLFSQLKESYLKKVLRDEDPEVVENLLKIKVQYDKAKTKEDKKIYRDRLGVVFWDLFESIGKNLRPDTPKEKRLFLRFHILDLKYLSVDFQKEILSQPFESENTDIPLYYVDEWILGIKAGQIKPSASDEIGQKTSAKKNSKDNMKAERLKGKMDGELNAYSQLYQEKMELENFVKEITDGITASSGITNPDLKLPDTYNQVQLDELEKLSEKARELKVVGRKLLQIKNSFYDAKNEYEKVSASLPTDQNGNFVSEVSNKTVKSEIDNIRQMVKMAVGRQGNHFPILHQGLLPKGNTVFNFKDQALQNISQIEDLDYTIFNRTYKGVTSNIKPYILLLPGYGSNGFCWEPFDKFNKATSRGKIMLPIFPKSSALAVTMSFGDFRWQVAKEMAGYHWMNEGLTGRYFQYLEENKIRGDITNHFINDYILWITKEAEGVQKMNKDSRMIFWKYIPFTEEKKEELAKRGFYYQDLMKRDDNIQKSRGY